VTADVIVEAEVPVILSHVPVSCCHDTVHERSVVQHRKVKPRTIPADEPRRVMLHRLEKLLDQRRFRVPRLTKRAHAKPVIVTKGTAYDGNLLQMQREKLVADGFATCSVSAFDHLGIRHIAPPVVERPKALDIWNRFEIKDERWRHYRCGRNFAGSSGVPPRR